MKDTNKKLMHDLVKTVGNFTMTIRQFKDIGQVVISYVKASLHDKHKTLSQGLFVNEFLICSNPTHCLPSSSRKREKSAEISRVKINIVNMFWYPTQKDVMNTKASNANQLNLYKDFSHRHVIERNSPLIRKERMI